MARRTGWLVALLLTVISVPLLAVTYMVPTDRDLIARSAGIAVVTAIESHGEIREGGRIVTVTHFRVEDALKGAFERGTELEVMEPGGRVGDRVTVIFGVPQFVGGERYLLVLARDKARDWTTYGFGLGMFHFVTDLRGREFLIRGGSEGVFGFREGGEEPYVEHYRDAAGFLTYIRTVVHSSPVPAPAAYEVERSEVLLGRFPQFQPQVNFKPAVQSSRIDYLMNYSGTYFRWQNGANFSLVYCCGATPQPGYDAAQAASAPASAWNGTGTSISMGAASPDAAATAGFTAIDGKDAVLFNDPHNEVPAGVVGIGGFSNQGASYQVAGDPNTYANPTEVDVVVAKNLSVTQAVLNSIVTHEIGHTLGFRHSDKSPDDSGGCSLPLPCAPVGQALMASNIQNLTSLQTWDYNAAQTVYGSGPTCVPPSIATHPQSKTIVSGTTTTLSVNANGDAPLVYQWYQASSPTKSNPVGTDSPVFNTPALAVTTPYWVLVSGCTTSASSNTATITVTCTPEINQQPQDASIFAGGSATLTIGSIGATTIQWYVGSPGATTTPAGNGSSLTVSPSTTTTYWARLTGCNGESRDSVGATVSVSACVAPVISLQPKNVTITAGQSTTLVIGADGTQPINAIWYSSTYPSTATIAGFGFSLSVTPAVTTSYWARITGACPPAVDTTVATVTVTVPGCPSVTVGTPTKTPGAAGATTLAVTASGGTGLTYTWFRSSPGSAQVGTGASISVTPAVTSTYFVRVKNDCGNTADSVAVTVTVSGPNIILSVLPKGMLQAAGSPSSDSYTLTNVGTDPGTITLTQTGSFFTQSPTSFTLAASASQIVSISSAPQPAGNYTGASLASGTGVAAGFSVPIALVVATPPASPVTATSGSMRADFAAPPGENPIGSVSFTNPSAFTITGIVVADAPWIILPSPFLTIGPGETKTVTFTINRALRPDGGAPGGAEATLTFRYVNTAAGKAAILGTTVLTDLSVSLVDVVTLTTTRTNPPALGAGELALFVPGASPKLSSLGDLFLSNKGTDTIADMQLFFAPAGAGAQSLATSVPQFLSNTGVSFPGVVKNIFASTQAGTLQVRSAKTLNVSVAAQQVTAGLGASYVTALPLMRSDVGAAAGGAVYLAGVRKDLASQTNLYVQEMSGNSATLAIDYFNGAGGTIGTTTTATVGAFGALDLQDAVPTGAVVARVRNSSSNAAKISGYATVVDKFTTDQFTVVDLQAGSGETLFCPAFPPVGGKTRDFSIYLTNSGSSTISVTASTATSSTGRRRSSSHTGGNPPASAQDTLTIPPLGLTQLHVSGDSGFVKLTGSTQSLHASGSFSMSGGNGLIGTGLPVVPASSALGTGETRRFVGVNDSSTDAIAASRPLTYRSNLLLVETTGQAVTVRLTIRFVFAAGVTVSAGTTVTKDVDISGGGFVLISDIGRSFLGAQRDAYGDIRNALLDVVVTSGSGKVLAFLESIDNATRDVTVRYQ